MQFAATHDRETRRERKRDTKRQRESWTKSRKAEKQFARTLRGLARRIGSLTREVFDPNDVVPSANRCRALLDRYSETLRPWADSVAKRMIADVSRKDEAVWAGLSKEMGRALETEIKSAPIENYMRRRHAEVVDLITSLPRDAAARIGKLTLEAMVEAKRADEVADDIMRTGHVSRSRAMLIARTEVSRTSGLLVQERAQHVGSTHYRWVTAGDIDVRRSHKKLNGKIFAWNDPPVAGENGEKAHPGGIFNCRCYSEPILSEESE